jgi:inward rectifier potassium channel
MSLEEMKAKNLEIFILTTAFDESFNQNIHHKYAYKFSDIIWNAKFDKMFHIAEDGNWELEIEKLNNYSKL